MRTRKKSPYLPNPFCWIKGIYLKYVAFAKTGSSVIYAAWPSICSVTSRVSLVFGVCRPPKVRHTIIFPNSIPMRDYWPSTWLLANKRLRNKSMNIFAFGFSVLTKVYVKISVFPHPLLEIPPLEGKARVAPFDSPSGAPNLSARGYFIAFKSSNLSPNHLANTRLNMAR